MTTHASSGIQTLLELPVRAGEEERVVALFRSLNIFGLAGRNAGFLGAHLLVPHERGKPFVVVARWADEDAIARWVEDPERARTNAELAPCLDGAAVRREYTPALAYAADSQQP